jgi:Lamin Tail Domain
VVLINEWLPNPVGADAAGEFLELYNNGASAVPLTSWSVKTEKGKTFSLAGRTIPPRGYLVLEKSETKLTLRNTDGDLSLYAPDGTLADHGKFSGNAPEGKSFSRVNDDTGPSAHFLFAAPTPGAANRTPVITVATNDHPYGIPLDPQFTSADFFAIMVGTAALLTGLIHYLIKHHEDLSKLLSASDKSIWGEIGETGEEDGTGKP